MVAREPRWLLRCLYAVAKVPGVVALVLLGYPGLLLWCFYAVAKMPLGWLLGYLKGLQR